MAVDLLPCFVEITQHNFSLLLTAFNTQIEGLCWRGKNFLIVDEIGILILDIYVLTLSYFFDFVNELVKKGFHYVLAGQIQ